jgi:probable blue pigment (indigoidine) exporter
MTSTVLVIALTALAPLAWGTTYSVTTELLPHGHPMFAALMRSLPGGFIALLCTRRLPSGSWWWRAPILGTLNIGAFFPLLFVAAQRLPGGVAATIGAIQPLLVAGLAVAVLREQPSLWRIGWAFSAAIGVALVVLGPEARLDAVGVAAGLGGAVAMALGITLSKRWGVPPGVPPLALAGWQLISGGLLLAPLVLLTEGDVPELDVEGLAGFIWLGSIGGVVAYTLWFRGISRLPVTATALLALLSPLTAAVIGAAALGERLGPIQLTGLVVALTSLGAGQFKTPNRHRSPNPPSEVTA